MRSYGTRAGGVELPWPARRCPLSTASVNALVAVTSSRGLRLEVLRGTGRPRPCCSARELGVGGAGRPRACPCRVLRAARARRSCSRPAFSVSENSLLSPGAMFSTSPMMRSPDRTSNSLTSPEPVLVTLNVVGPALMVSFAGQPSSLIVDLHRGRLRAPPRRAAERRRRATVQLRAAIAHGATECCGTSVQILPVGRWSDGFDGRGDRRGCGVGARRAARCGRQHVDRHGDRVGEEGEHLAARWARAGCRTCR